MKNLLTSGKFHIDPVTLDFPLPDSLIAQEPPKQRDQARLMVVDRETGDRTHGVFSDLPRYLKAGDVLVLNKARVNKAKVVGRKESGGRVEVIFLEPDNSGEIWKALVRPFLREGTKIIFPSGEYAVLMGRTEAGENLLKPENFSPADLMATMGEMPLPPYIKRERADARKKSDEVDYQTVYASAPGSVAAPTAGLHFSANLLERLQANGIDIVTITLHVGWGTFKPISGSLDAHRMLAERFEISRDAISHLASARRENRRIVAVGTTSTRVLESLPENPPLQNWEGETSLFIKPGFSFRWVKSLVTNFHVPKSTPVSLTAAFAGLDRLELAYEEAVEKGYRFFSYGDAMLIL